MKIRVHYTINDENDDHCPLAPIPTDKSVRSHDHFALLTFTKTLSKLVALTMCVCGVLGYVL